MPSPTTDLVRSYLKEIGRYPLLTPEQEITNARALQQMMAIEEQRLSLALELNRQPITIRNSQLIIAQAFIRGLEY
ncbi:sigma-70 factor domain-containing protein [Nostoc sp. UIC 10630]|uniref:sigma-70 factor domain-containing protein n=1 Tax=Nostoc sp. UIC 10630 TaxID=2100146 RepID=UPI001FB18864|nr:sigma-70 factor domain-containing protein [Nostoc sp. UIC 10630]